MSSKKWAVELKGGDLDRRIWQDALKPRFDPYVELVECLTPPCVALHSTEFDELATSEEVFARAKELFKRLNTAMSACADASALSPGTVIEFAEGGPPRRHHRLVAEPGSYSMRGAPTTATIVDLEGNIIPQPETVSIAQQWMRAAAHHHGVAQAMSYMSGNPGWAELYKAHEALHDSGLAADATPETERKRFTRTANAGPRHREGKFEPHEMPMTLEGGRDHMRRRLATAVDEVLKGLG